MFPLEYTVVGEAVNLAANLEKHNKQPGSQALISAACYGMAQVQGYDPSSAFASREKKHQPLFLLKSYPAQSVAGMSDRINLQALCRCSQAGKRRQICKIWYPT